MITAHSSVVHMPPGHYDNIAQVIRYLVKRHPGYKKGESKYRKPRYPRTRPGMNIRIDTKSHEWRLTREEIDPDGLLELWSLSLIHI